MLMISFFSNNDFMLEDTAEEDFSSDEGEDTSDEGVGWLITHVLIGLHPVQAPYGELIFFNEALALP